MNSPLINVLNESDPPDQLVVNVLRIDVAIVSWFFIAG